MQKLQLQLGPSQVLMRRLKESKFSADLDEFGRWFQIWLLQIEYSSNHNMPGLPLVQLDQGVFWMNSSTHLVGIIFSYVVYLGNERFD